MAEKQADLVDVGVCGHREGGRVDAAGLRPAPALRRQRVSPEGGIVRVQPAAHGLPQPQLLLEAHVGERLRVSNICTGNFVSKFIRYIQPPPRSMRRRYHAADHNKPWAPPAVGLLDSGAARTEEGHHVGKDAPHLTTKRSGIATLSKRLPLRRR